MLWLVSWSWWSLLIIDTTRMLLLHWPAQKSKRWQLRMRLEPGTAPFRFHFHKSSGNARRALISLGSGEQRRNCKQTVKVAKGQIVTSGSQVVTQPTTGDAQGSFASGSGRERAFSAWYERSMKNSDSSCLCTAINLSALLARFLQSTTFANTHICAVGMNGGGARTTWESVKAIICRFRRCTG